MPLWLSEKLLGGFKEITTSDAVTELFDDIEEINIEPRDGKYQE